MTIVFYDLVGADDRRFSPHCWRTRMALAHKGLDVEARATRFTEIPGICGGGQKTIPVIEDGDTVVGDSWAIANYLEDAYPDRPSLFGGPGGRATALFVNNWAAAVLHPGVVRCVVADIHDHVTDEDKAYFRTSREKRFGKPLEEVQAGRDESVKALRTDLTPLRLTVQSQPFLGGDGPLYPDYLAFGALQWARSISPFKILEADDPIGAWFERCLDLYDGLGRAAPGYD